MQAPNPVDWQDSAKALQSTAIGVDEKATNVRNKLVRGKFTAAFTAMSGIHRDDRPALIALALMLGAIVFVTFFEIGARQSFNHRTPNGDSAQVNEQQEGQLTESSTGGPEYRMLGDTIPQWVMAVFGVAATVISGVAVKWVRDTLLATRTSNEIATASAERQSRAYVHLADVRVTEESSGSVVNPNYRAWVSWNNVGQTPTRYMTWSLQITSVIGEIPPDFEFKVSHERIGFASLGPGQKTRDCSIELSIVDVDLARLCMRNLYLWGHVDYGDVFTDSRGRRTEFCVNINVTEGADGSLSFLPHTHEKHNGADEECMHPAGLLG